MKSKGRLPYHFTVLGKGVVIGDFRAAEVGYIKSAIIIKHFRIAELYGLTSLALNFEADNTDHILPHVININAWLGLFDGQRLQGFNDPYRWPLMRREHCLFRFFLYIHIYPSCRLHVGSCVPSSKVKACVISLAVIDVTGNDWSSSCLPAIVCGDDLRGAIFKCHFQLSQKRQCIAPYKVSFFPTEVSCIPTVSQNSAQKIITAF